MTASEIVEDFFRLSPDNYADMFMWHFNSDIRSDDYLPSAIPADLVKEGVLIFLGKHYPIDQLD